MWDSLKETVHNPRPHIFKTRRWQKQDSSVPSTLDFSDSYLYLFNFRNDKHQFPPSPESPWPTKPCLINTGFPCLSLHGWKRNPNPGQHLTPQSGPAHLRTLHVGCVQIGKPETGPGPRASQPLWLWPSASSPKPHAFLFRTDASGGTTQSGLRPQAPQTVPTAETGQNNLTTIHLIYLM